MLTFCQGLFKQAISLSGTALCPWSQADAARTKTFTIAKHLGCPLNDTNHMVKCLQERPAKKIVQLSKLFIVSYTY